MIGWTTNGHSGPSQSQNSSAPMAVEISQGRPEPCKFTTTTFLEPKINSFD